MWADVEVIVLGLLVGIAPPMLAFWITLWCWSCSVSRNIAKDRDHVFLSLFHAPPQATCMYCLSPPDRRVVYAYGIWGPHARRHNKNDTHDTLGIGQSHIHRCAVDQCQRTLISYCDDLGNCTGSGISTYTDDLGTPRLGTIQCGCIRTPGNTQATLATTESTSRDDLGNTSGRIGEDRVMSATAWKYLGSNRRPAYPVLHR